MYDSDQNLVRGRVEVCINNAWGTICRDSFFDSVDAGVICQQLGGFTREPMEIFSNSSGVGPVFLSRVECANEDMQLLDCQRSSLLGLVDELCDDHSNDVSVSCSGILKVINKFKGTRNSINQYLSSILPNLLILHVECLIILSLFCLDINECLIDNGNCTHICNNTIGGFECLCQYGFELQNDSITCIGKEVMVIIILEVLVFKHSSIIHN